MYAPIGKKRAFSLWGNSTPTPKGWNSLKMEEIWIARENLCQGKRLEQRNVAGMSQRIQDLEGKFIRINVREHKKYDLLPYSKGIGKLL